MSTTRTVFPFSSFLAPIITQVSIFLLFTKLIVWSFVGSVLCARISSERDKNKNKNSSSSSSNGCCCCLLTLVYRYEGTAHNEGEEERGEGREPQDAEAG
jgi:hypothetical protein